MSIDGLDDPSRVAQMVLSNRLANIHNVELQRLLIVEFSLKFDYLTNGPTRKYIEQQHDIPNFKYFLSSIGEDSIKNLREMINQTLDEERRLLIEELSDGEVAEYINTLDVIYYDDFNII